MSYQVWIKSPQGDWVRVSREFEREHQAQDWALDLEPRLPREVRREPGLPPRCASRGWTC